MRFYDALQLDPAVLKAKIRTSESAGERRRLWIAMAMRSLLIVMFAILCISPAANVFGAENNPMAVALFCILLGVRFVDFNYCIKDSMINLAIIFLLLLFAPVVADYVHPLLAVFIHFAAFFAILIMGADRPEFGNGGLFGFAYVFLTGNPVTGALFWKRFALTGIGYLICGAIFLAKHRNKNRNIPFRQIISRFDMSTEKSRWQLRMALGVSLVLTLGNCLQIQRFMWIGFACAALLSTYPYSVSIKQRYIHRVAGVVAGSALFFVIYQLTPDSLHSMLGPLGGICLGFCADYRFKTGFNCFGALMMAAGLYGVGNAAALRVVNNVAGLSFAVAVIWLYQKLVESRFENRTAGVQESAG